MPYKDPHSPAAKASMLRRSQRYRQTAKGKAAMRAAAARYEAAHPEETRARSRRSSQTYRDAGKAAKPYVRTPRTVARMNVRIAIKAGRLIRQPCWCGGIGQAHHARGYEPAHWLDVEWLCPVHHAAAHKAMREGVAA